MSLMSIRVSHKVLKEIRSHGYNNYRPTYKDTIFFFESKITSIHQCQYKGQYGIKVYVNNDQKYW